MDGQKNNLDRLSEAFTSNEPQCEQEQECDAEPESPVLTEPECQTEMECNPHITKHSITITQLDYGYIIKVGCQDFAFETSENLIKQLDKYLKNPIDTEKDWYKNKKLT